MTEINYRIPTSGRCKVAHYHNSVSNKNPVTGRVDTRVQSPFTRTHQVSVTDFPGTINGSLFYAIDAISGATQPPSTVSMKARLTAEARARFDGRIRAGHADLGVTIGSWKQSWDMIAKRGRDAARSLDRAHLRLTERLNNSARLEAHRNAERRRRDLKRWIGSNNYLETPAGLVLEGEFGWLPLFEDAAKALSVMTKPVPNGWVTGRGKGAIYDVPTPTGNPLVQDTYSGRMSVTICANVWVDNPNLWLANQMGVLNLPGVAWDLVPWSFVVNMFTNLGQIANSFTSYYGLGMNNTSTTTSLHWLREQKLTYVQAPTTPARASVNNDYKQRLLGTIPAVPLVFRMPELNWNTALLAVSLAIQQVSRITKLLS